MRRTMTTLEEQTNYTTARLYMAMELSRASWKLALSDGNRESRTMRSSVDAGDLNAVLEVIERARRRFALEPETAVLSVHEVGRDGFWIHRVLEANGIVSLPLDAASIEVNRQHRRRKTDSMDVELLLRRLIAWQAGDTQVFSVCTVPSRQDEDDRRLGREQRALKKDRTALINRIRSLLVLHSAEKIPLNDVFIAALDSWRGGDGSALGACEKAEIRRTYQRLQLVNQQLKELEAQRNELLAERKNDSKMQAVTMLQELVGVGPITAWDLVMEMYGWRQFENRRQVGRYVGLDPSPYNTGASARDQGIAKSGNARVRALLIQLAWRWVRWQPDSELGRWYRERWGDKSKRLRKIGITALARKLAVRLYHFVQYGEVPNGARLAR